MSSTPCLYGSEAWTEYLAERTLPVRVSILTRFKRLLQDDNTTLQQLSQLIRSDPVLSLQVTRIAQKLHAAKGSSVTSIDHAVNSVGLDQLALLAEGLQSLKISPRNMQQKMYFRAIADSLHASSQAAELCRQRRLPFVEEVRLAALLYGFGHWLLWLHAPLHKHEYQKKVLLEKVDVALAEQDVFGCTVQALSAELAKHWGLPELTLAALDHDTSPSRSDLQLLHRRALKDPRLGQLEQREINQLTQERFFPVKLGNWLALTSTRGWQSKKTLRLYDIAADFLSWPRDRLVAQLHQTCAEASRQYHVPGTLSPAAQMLFLPSEETLSGLIESRELQQLKQHYPPPEKPVLKKPEPPREEHHTRERPAVTTHAREDLYTQIMQRLQDGYSLYTKPAHILQALLQGLHQGLGLGRIALLLINPKKRLLHCARTLGIADTAAINQLIIDIEIPSLFKRLTDKPAGIWLDRAKRKTLRPMLPNPFIEAAHSGDYLLMSVFHKGEPLAILYADDGDDAEHLSEFQYEQFRQLCAAATLALKRL